LFSAVIFFICFQLSFLSIFSAVIFFIFFSCRFLFGGDHGRLKYSPPENFSPLYECLLPNQSLYIDPGGTIQLKHYKSADFLQLFKIYETSFFATQQNYILRNNFTNLRNYFDKST
jgi:hypothetical protein